MIFIVMGVAGSGKTTVGRLLAEQLGWEFLDADDFHPAENVEKMSRGIPLTDEDRTGWLATLAGLITERVALGSNAALACSALKQSYRSTLGGNDKRVQYIYLKGSQEQIAARMRARPGHFMQPGLLASQFAALEEPRDAFTVEINRTPNEITRQVIEYFNLSS